MMTKSETIDAITSLNPGVSPVFLAEFSADELNAYLCRLRDRSQSYATDGPAGPSIPVPVTAAGCDAPATRAPM